MKRMIALATFLILSAPAPAAAQDATPFKDMYFFHGSCNRLVLPEGDRSSACNKAVGRVRYQNGRTSFWFSIPNKSLIAFSGMNADERRGTLKLDLVTIASTPGNQIRGGDGIGSCTFSNMWKGRAHISCHGRNQLGEFTGEFTSDGKPPEKVGD